jgi:hypothetical protein
VGAYKVCANLLDHGPHRNHNVRILLRADDEWPPFPCDARFLCGDRFDGIPEELLMVQINDSEGGHNDAIIGNGVRGIRAPSHTDFENDDVKFGQLK